MPTSQPVRVNTPFGDDLLFSRMDGFEELGRLYQYDLELLSPKEDLSLDDLLGKDITVELDLPNGKTRYFHGYVTEFALTGGRGRYATYSAVMHPWFWFLTRTSDCRIFQNKTVPDIIKEVFRDLGFTDFKDSLSAEYREWEYCVQYRETNFNFVSRLMEQEGIYYFWEQKDGKHTMVLADAYGAHSPLPDYDAITYYAPTETRREEHIFDWNLSKSVQSGTCVIGAFHFIKPKANLEVTKSIIHPHTHEDFEIYDYPGEYYERGEGDRYANVRIEELACDYERCRGEADARGIFPGGLFQLENFSRDDQNREYLVISAQHSLIGVSYETGDQTDFKYNCSFEVINSQDPFRAARTTPKPIVQGPQTAIVVGKSGEEIWTDEYGRVKVHFHWDRHGKKDENASCWVRVAQVWAGGQWGGMTIPRMGQEVIVDFIEGDPDRPIITGRVYNADNMPPYDLPAEKTKSTLKSQSSKGGTASANFNEIRFEDKKGSEEMYLHAEKDQNIMVENNKGETVGNDNTESIGNDEKIDVGNNRDKTVGVDQTEAIGSNKTITVGTDHTESIGANKKMDVGSNHTESIGSNKTMTVGSNHSETIGSNMTQNVGANKAETIAVGKALTVGAGYQVSVGSSMNQTIGASKTQQIGASASTDVGKDSAETIGKDKSIKAAKKIVMTSGDDFGIKGDKRGMIEIKDELTIKVGKAMLVMKKNGDIVIDGKKINIKGSGNITIKGKKILQN